MAARARTLADSPALNPKAKCGVGPVDREMGGFGVGSTSTLYGEPGAGKSVFAVRCASGLARSLGAPALLVCPEMSENMLQRVASIAGADLSLLTRCREPDNWEEEAAALGALVVVIDSVSVMTHPVSALEDLIAYTQDVDGVGFALAHMNQSGSPLGPAGLRYHPDGIFKLELGRDGRRLRVQKCRWASPASVISLEGAAPEKPSSPHHRRRGLVRVR
jgi:predicted ATP-dependent serine protease